MEKRDFFLVLGIIFLIISVLLVLNCKKTTDNDTYMEDLVGTWSGTWTDTVYQVSGTLSVTFSKNETTVTATGTIGLSSFGLGSITGTGTGTIDDNAITFTFIGGALGNGTGTISGSSASGSGTIGGTLGFGPFTFTGEVKATEITGNFVFTNPGGGKGTVTLTKELVP